jgi:hypothetical protein
LYLGGTSFKAWPGFNILSDIWGFHSSEDDYVLLGFDTLLTCRQMPLFWRNILSCKDLKINDILWSPKPCHD